MSFNGGKDCTVLLDLYLQLIPQDYDGPCHLFYLAGSPTFPEVDRFIDEYLERFPRLVLHRYTGSMKAALCSFKRDCPQIRAVLIGVRRTDPNCAELDLTNATDTAQGWPSFMRIHPLLNCNYAQIWDHLKSNKVPYCPLYDQGYTSLGDADKTHPNPALNQNGNSYLPAFMLQDEALERSGRET